MKRVLVFIAIAAIISLMFYLGYNQHLSIQHTYTVSINEYLDHVGAFNDYAEPYEVYFSHKFNYPKNKAGLELFMNRITPGEQVNYLQKDPFSKNDLNLLYLPLYSKESNLREGIAIISSGIDGKINHDFKDTMYVEDLSKMNFYNDVPDPVVNKYQVPDTNFHLLNYLVGRKDLLVFYKDGIESFKNNDRNFSVPALHDYLLNRRYRDIEFDCTINGSVSEVNDSYIILSADNIVVYCLLYDGREYPLKLGDEIKLAAQFKGAFREFENTIFLVNCIVLNHNN